MTTGGAERVVSTLANALSALGNDVVIGMLKGDQSEYPLDGEVGLRTARLSPGARSLPKAVRFYATLVRRERPDVVLSFTTKPNLIALIARVIYRVPTSLIVSERADPFSRPRIEQAVYNTIYKWSDGLVCQSEVVGAYYRKKCKNLSVSIIGNPLNTDCIASEVATSRVPIVISVGRLADQKNYPLALEVFGDLLERFPNLQMKIFGSGPKASSLRESIESSGLSDSVSLEGTLPNVFRSYADASLFLFTSDYEGFPNVLLEAVASGIPVVSTDFSPGTAHEIVVDGVSGYIVSVGDRGALVDASEKVLNDSLRHEGLVERSRAIRRLFNLDVVADMWLEAIRESRAASGGEEA